jgi:hypothetical protein
MAIAQSNHGPRFSYRRNKDDSIDAICLICFLTAGTAHSEAQLHELEAGHQCQEVAREAGQVA